MLNSTVTFMMYRILSLFHIVYMFVLKTVQSIYGMRILNWIYMSMKNDIQTDGIVYTVYVKSSPENGSRYFRPIVSP